MALSSQLRRLTGILRYPFSPLSVCRDMSKEGAQDEAASRAYAGVRSLPIFLFVRWTILSALRSIRTEGTVVDVGSGPGYLAAAVKHRYPRLAVVGLDVNRTMVSIASARTGRRSSRPEFVLGAAERLPFKHESIGLIISSLSLHHWSDPASAFAEFRRVLLPGSRVLILDPRRDSRRFVLWGFGLVQMLSPKDIRRTNGAVGSLLSSYTAGEVCSMLERAGFQEVVVREGLGWLVAHAVKIAHGKTECMPG